MNEERFRHRFRGALGEPPPSDLQRRLEANASAGPPGRTSSRLGPFAATFALLIIAGLVGWRVVYQRATAPVTVKRWTVATASPTVAAVDPLTCRLPVVVIRESGPPGQLVTEPGFVDTHTGRYVKDGSASIAGLPGGAFEGTDVKPSRPAAAVWSSVATKRWLPVGNTMIAPDGHSYLWVRLLPQGSNIAPGPAAAARPGETAGPPPARPCAAGPRVPSEIGHQRSGDHYAGLRRIAGRVEAVAAVRPSGSHGLGLRTTRQSQEGFPR